MSDTTDTQAPEQGAAAEATAAESQPVEQAKPAEGEQGKPEGEPQKPAEAPAAPTGEQKQEQKPQTHQSRRSSRFMAKRIETLAKENANLKRQNSQSSQEDDTGNEDPGDDNAGNDRIAQLEATVKQLQQSVNPVMTATQQAADDGELSELFSGDKAKDRAEYEPQIRKMWELPQYKDVAASDLHAMLVGRNIDSIVQKAVEAALAQAKEAEKEAKESSASGSSNTSNRTGKSGKAISDMTDDELIAHNNRVKAGQA